MSWPRPVRVIGVGSAFGDDALAWEVVRRLESENSGNEVSFHAVAGGHRILDVLDGRGTAILIDALACADNPGMLHRFEWPDERIDKMRPSTTHHVRPAEALQIAATLGILPPRVIVWGVEATRFYPESGLSESVARGLSELIHRLHAELRAGLAEHTRDQSR